MIIGKKVKERLSGQFVPSKKRVSLRPGESVRVARELLGLSQKDLSEKTGLAQSTISAIELGYVNLGLERAKTLARALQVHPSVLVFSDWDPLENEDIAA